MLKKLMREGIYHTTHKTAIDPKDMELMFSSGTLSDNNPISLQNKVFMEIALHFGSQGSEAW
jgi:hypothetical protein